MISPKDVKEIVANHAEYLRHNFQLIDIWEGNLSHYVDEDLKNQLSLQSYLQAKHRMAPINILPKFIDKLTNIYQTGVVRSVENGTETDAALVGWYQEMMNINKVMNCSNELFNLCKSTLLYPYIHQGVPQLRAVLNDRFVVYSDDPINPTYPTHVILLGDKIDGKDIFWVWSANEFMISDSDEKVRPDLMMKYQNADGINPIGRLPFVYVNESEYKLCPVLDSDTLKMVRIIPVMLSDLNLAAMFQCFSIVYGIDLNDENLQYAPNAFWSLKSDSTTDKKPEIGTIKPQVDYDQVLKLIESELSMWLGTKGIRASTVGALTQDNFQSGISKIIDEMDTFEARQKQVSYFTTAEADLWDLILNYMNPYWSESGMIDMNARWTPTAEVNTVFAAQLPMQSRGQVVRDLRDEYAAGFISRRRALMKINPELTEEEIEDLIVEIDQERGIDTSMDQVEEDMTEDGSEAPSDNNQDS